MRLTITLALSAILLAGCSDDPTCADGLVTCDGRCIDPDTNPEFCGATSNCTGDDAGQPCLTGQVCSSGQCAWECPATQEACEGGCFGLSTSLTHCGACGNACGDGLYCYQGTCTALGTISCDGVAVELLTDEANCGGCGIQCPTGATCESGACICPDALPTACGGACLDVNYEDQHCGGCGNACSEGTHCFDGACASQPVFQIASLGAESCTTLTYNHERVTGDDRGGIAVSTEGFFYTGDDATGRWSLDLGSATFLDALYDGIVSDLLSGTLYTLWSDDHAFVNDDAVITALAEIDPLTNLPSETPLALAEAITVGDASLVFAGAGRVAVYTGGNLFEIDPSSGSVTDRGDLGGVYLSTQGCENWAAWGVLEYDGEELHLVFVEDSETIARYRVSNGTRTVAGTFEDISDMCSFTVAPRLGRWYWHQESESQFTELDDENAGYCDAGWRGPAGMHCPAARQDICGAACVDFQSDAQNCGSCGNVCEVATPICSAGACVAPPEPEPT